MEENLIKAPIDEKNISTDWIESVFDCNDFCCSSNGKKYVGFVYDVPAWCEIYDNYVSWELCGDEKIEHSFVELKYKLNQIVKELPDIVVKFIDHRYGDGPISGTTMYFYFIEN